MLLDNGRCVENNTVDFKECVPETIEQFREKQKLAQEASTGNQESARKLTEILVKESTQLAQVRFGDKAASGVVAIGLFLRASDYSPMERLNVAMALRAWVQVGPNGEVRSRLENVGQYIRPYLDDVSAAAKAPRFINLGRGPALNYGALHPSARGSDAEDAVLWAVGLEITRNSRGDVSAFDGISPLLDVIFFGIPLGKALFSFAKGGIEGLLSAGLRGVGRDALGEGTSPLARALGDCVNSFSANTKVAVEKARKASVAISSLTLGSTVLAYNEQTKTEGEQSVTHTIHHTDQVIVWLTLKTDDEKVETLETTEQHPFYALTAPRADADGVWTDAGKLKFGNWLKRADGRTGMVVEVKRVAQAQEMYNLTVETAHTFFVGDGQWLVHNCNAIVDGVRVAASAEGKTFATTADEVFSGLSSGARRSATVAVSEANGVKVVAINSGASPEAVAAVRSWAESNGYTFVYKPGLTGQAGHAEQVLYGQYSNSVNTIGVSHYTGPCPGCQQAFNGTGVQIAWTGIWK